MRSGKEIRFESWEARMKKVDALRKDVKTGDEKLADQSLAN